jgi:hypothetical protein
VIHPDAGGDGVGGEGGVELVVELEGAGLDDDGAGGLAGGGGLVDDAGVEALSGEGEGED